MAQDKTNIFKLSEKEQKEYIKDPFFDCMPGAEDFAKALEKDILTKETPHSVLLEANYGMGKTFFSTRFAQYLRNNKLEAIYFSAWENDYLSDPFLSFSKELVGYFSKNATIYKKAEKTLEFPIEILIKLVQSLSVNAGVCSLDASKLFESFKQDTDPVQEFKKEFSVFIKNLKNKKLVLIVDELDRCRPDYAMKVLEILKHFFDIEGLFVIVPTNKWALETSLEALYGIKIKETEKRVDCENYFKKFFNNEIKIPKPNYVKMVKNNITTTNIAKTIQLGYIIEADNKFNSLNILITALATYGKNAQLSLRQMTDICKKMIHICNHFYEEIRSEYIAYLICLEECKKKKNVNGHPVLITLSDKIHPYYCNTNSFGGFEDNSRENAKIKLLNISNLIDSINKFQTYGSYEYSSYNNFRNKLLGEFNSGRLSVFNSYQEFCYFIDERKNEIANVKTNTQGYPNIIRHLESLDDVLIKKEQEVKNYQEKYGSDDADKERQARYKEIIEKPETLYNI